MQTILLCRVPSFLPRFLAKMNPVLSEQGDQQHHLGKDNRRDPSWPTSNLRSAAEGSFGFRGCYFQGVFWESPLFLTVASEPLASVIVTDLTVIGDKRDRHVWPSR